MGHEILIPDIEIVIGAGGNEVAVVCFYQRGDIHQGYDVVSGISHPDARAVVRAVLSDAIKALDSAAWYDVDGLRATLDTVMDGETP